MKKILSLAVAFTVILSLSACTMRNNRIYSRTGVKNNTDITGRRMSETNDNIRRNTNYKDGVYTGYGDAHRNGNERAIVQIRNGRIVNIILSNISQQRATNNTIITGEPTLTSPGTRIDNQTGTNMAAKNERITSNELTRGNIIEGQKITTPGSMKASPGTSTSENLPSNRTRDLTGNTTGTGAGNTIGYTQGNIPSSVPRNTTGNIMGFGEDQMNRVGGGTMGTPVGTTLDGAKNSLINTMIQEQRADVNIINNDPRLTSTINNWKLAVSRALRQAGR